MLAVIILALAVLVFVGAVLLYLAKSPHAPTFVALGLALFALSFLWPHFSTLH